MKQGYLLRLAQGKTSQEDLQCESRVVAGRNLAVDIPETKMNACQQFLIGQKSIQKLVPIRNSAMLEDQLEREIFQQKKFGSIH